MNPPQKGKGNPRISKTLGTKAPAGASLFKMLRAGAFVFGQKTKVSSVKRKLKFSAQVWNVALISAMLVALTGVLNFGFLIDNNTSAAPGINEQINFQARLLNDDGSLVADGDYHLRFRIYCGGDGALAGAGSGADCTHATDEDLLWTETHSTGNLVTVANGYLYVQLGSITAFGSNVDWNEDELWLSMEVGGTSGPTWDGEMDPFLRFTSVPYAFNADLLDGLDSNEFLQVGQGTTQVDATNNNSIVFNKTGTGDFLRLQDGGTTELSFDQDGNLTIGSASEDGALILSDGSSNYITFDQAALSSDITLTWNVSSDCTGNANGGSLTVNGSNEIVCSDDDGGGASPTLQSAYDNGNTIGATTGRDIQFDLQDVATDPDFIIDIENNSTSVVEFQYNSVADLRVDSSGVDLLDVDVADFTGATVTFDAGEIETGDISDGTVLEADLNVTNAPAGLDNYVLTLNEGSNNFTWVDPSTIGNSPFTDGGSFVYPTNTEDLVLGGTTTGAADIWLQADGTAVFNQQGASVNFTVEANGVADALIVQGSDGQITLGALDCSGNANGGVITANASGVLSCDDDDGAGAGNSLQGAYDQGNTILTTDARDIDVTLANTTTDSNFLIDIATGSTSRFAVQGNGSDVLGVTSSGITLSVDTTVAAQQTITFVGGTTAQRPGSPSEGEVYYDTDTDSLLVYSNGKWVSYKNRGVLVAANDSSQADKDRADYVADGTSDEDEINSALTAATGAIVYLLEGTYVADGTILVPNETILAGQGEGTVIELADLDVTDNLIENSDTSAGTGMVIRDLKLDGRDDLNTAGTQTGIYINGSGDTNTNGATLENLLIEDFRSHGIYTFNNDGLVIRDIVTRDNGQGLRIFNSDRSLISDISDIDSDSTAAAVQLDQFRESTATNINVLDATGRGIELDEFDGSILSNSVVHDAGNYGIYLHDSDDATVDSNFVSGSPNTQIRLGTTVYNSLVTNNQAIGGTIGFDVSSVHRTVIDGNKAEDGSSWGYQVFSSSTSNIISNNQAINTGGATLFGGIIINGDRNTIVDNHFYDTSCSGTCEAIALGSGADYNFVSGNVFYNDSIIDDQSSTTSYGGQFNEEFTVATADLDFQAPDDINLNSDTVLSGQFTISGAVLDITTGSGEDLDLQANGAGIIHLDDTVRIGSLDCSGDANGGALTTNGSGDIICSDDDGGGAAPTLQSTYDNDDDDGAAEIVLTSTDGEIVIRDAASTIGDLFVVEANGGADYLTVNSSLVTVGTDLTVTAGNSLTLVGGNTASRPGSPSEGEIYFDTDTDTLLVYSNSKWQAYTGEYRIVAADDSTQAEKDSAHYVADATSDETEINSALTAAAGGKVLLLAGTYEIDGDIILANNDHLAGVGDGTVIQLANSMGSSVDMVEINGDYATISNLRIDGNKSNQTDSVLLRGISIGSGDDNARVENVTVINTEDTAIDAAGDKAVLNNLQIINPDSYGIYFTNNQNSLTNSYFEQTSNLEVGVYTTGSQTLIDGNNFEGWTRAIYLSDADNVASNNTILDPSITGIYIGSSDNVIDGNTVTSSADEGIRVASSNNSVTGNNVQDGTDEGIVVSSTQNTVTGNVAAYNGGPGFYISGSNNTISANTAQFNFSDHGFDIDGGDGNQITGNRIHGNGGAGASDGIHVQGDANNNSIVGNYISDTSGTGQAIDLAAGTVDNTYLADNVYEGTGADSINDSGTGTIYANQLNDEIDVATADLDIQAPDNINLNSNTVLTGTLNVSGETTLDGDVDLGDGTGDDITFLGYVDSDIIPDSDDSYDLGTNALRWQSLYLGSTTLYIGDGAGDEGTIGYDTTLNQLVLNEAGDDIDLRVESDTHTDAFVIQASDGQITFGSLDCSAGDQYLTANASGVLACGTDNGAGAGNDLQGAYDLGNTITTTDARDIDITLDDTTTDSNFLIDIATGSTSRFAVQGNGSDVLGVTSTGITLSVDTTVAAQQTITFVGGTTAQRPGSPSEGEIYFDTDTDSLLVYENGKWQSYDGEYIIVAANDSTQAEQDSAHYVADGTSDEDEINSALTAASGGKVLLLAGTYVADATILIPNNTTLQGVGPGTVIELADIDATDNLIENSDTSTGTGVVIRDLKLDGRDDLNTAGTQYAIFLDSVGDQTAARPGATIENLVIERVRSSSIHLDNSDNNIISNITIDEGGSGYQINNSNDSSYNTYSDLIVLGQGNGVRLAGRHNVITNSQINTDINAIYLDSTSYYNLIIENSLGGGNIGTNTGVDLSSAYNNTVSDNLFENLSSYGINLNHADNNLVSGNIFIDTGGAANNDAIYARLAALDNTIIGNYIEDSSCSTTCYAINLSESAVTDTYIADNTFDGGATINDAGTGTIYANQLNEDLDSATADLDIQAPDDINLNSDTVLSGQFTISGAVLDITTGSGEDLDLQANGAGIIHLDDTVRIGSLDCSGDANGGALTTNGSGDIICSDDDGGGGATLQGAYDAGNTLTTSTARDIDITLANTATDSDFTIDIATGSTSVFEVQNNGTADLRVDTNGVDLIDVDVADFSGATVTFDADEIADSEVVNSLTVSSAGSVDSTALTDGGTIGFDWVDDEVADTLTIGASGSVTWSALTSYPSACGAGTAVTTIGDTLTCTAFNTDTSITLDDAYEAGNNLTTSDNNNVDIVLADTATDSDFIINIASGSTSEILLQNNGTADFRVDTNGVDLIDVDVADFSGATVTFDAQEIAASEIANDSIGDTQLAFNTGQHLTTTSAPTFAGATMNGNLAFDNGTRTIAGIQNQNLLDLAAAETVSGAWTFSSASGLTVGTTSQVGQLVLTDGSATGTLTISTEALDGDYTLNFPTEIAANDTICLETLGNCVASTSQIASASFYDDTGGTTLANGSDTVVTIDATQRNNDTGVFSLASNEITIGEDADYLITYEVTASITSGTREDLIAKLELDTGGGYNDVAGSTARAYGRDTTLSGTASGSIVLDLDNGDTVRLVGQGNGQTFSTVADESRISFVQLKGPKGDPGPAGTADVPYLLVAATDAPQFIKDIADYTADGTSDEDEINSAISATTGLVILSSGTFTVDGDITLSPDVHIQGAGRDGTVITIPNNHNTDIDIFNLVSDPDVTISDLTIDGNTGNQSSGSMYGIDAFTSSDRVNVDNVNITNMRTWGMRLQNGGEGTVTNSYFTGNNGGLTVVAYSTISGNTFIGNTGVPVSIGGNSVIFSGNVVVTNTGDVSISGDNVLFNNNVVWQDDIDGSSSGTTTVFDGNNFDTGGIVSNTDNSTWSNNIFDNYNLTTQAIEFVIESNTFINGSGIDITSAGNNGKITDNYIDGSTQDGIEITYGADLLIANNRIHDVGGSGAFSGIVLEDSANNSRNTIIGNRITDTAGTGYAIEIEGSNVSDTYLADNTFSGTGATSILDSGTDTIWANQLNEAIDSATADLVLQAQDDINLNSDTVIGGDDIYLNVDGSAVFNEQGNSVDFRVESDTHTDALIVQGSDGQITFGALDCSAGDQYLTANASGVLSCATDDSGTGIFTNDTGFSYVTDTAENIVIGGTTEGAADIWLQATGGAVFNQQGADADFRIEGDTEENLFFVDAGNDRIAIGSATADELLHVQDGNILATANDVTVSATANDSPGLILRGTFDGDGGGGVFSVDRKITLVNDVEYAGTAGTYKLSVLNDSDAEFLSITNITTDDVQFQSGGTFEFLASEIINSANAVTVSATANDSPGLVLQGTYDADGGGGVASATRNITLVNDVEYAGTAGDYKLSVLNDSDAEFYSIQNITTDDVRFESGGTFEFLASEIINSANAVTVSASANNSPGLVLQGTYDADGGGGVASAQRNITLENIVEYAGTAGQYRLAVLDHSDNEFVTFEGDTQRVGVGTSTPAVEFEVSDTDQTGLQITGDDDGDGSENSSAAFLKLSEGTADQVEAYLGFSRTDGQSPEVGQAWSNANENSLLLGTTSSHDLQVGTAASVVLTINSAGNILFESLDCSGDANGGALTTNGSGQLICSDDDGGGTSEWTDGGTFLRPSDLSGAEDIVIGGTSTGAADIWLQATGAAVFNEQSADSDFRVESDNRANAFFVQGSNGHVGIGTNAPGNLLTIRNQFTGQSANLELISDNGSQVTDFWRLEVGANTNRLDIQNDGNTRFSIEDDGIINITNYITEAAGDIVFRTDDTGEDLDLSLIADAGSQPTDFWNFKVQDNTNQLEIQNDGNTRFIIEDDGILNVTNYITEAAGDIEFRTDDTGEDLDLTLVSDFGSQATDFWNFKVGANTNRIDLQNDGNDRLSVSSGGTLTLHNYDCSGNANGGALTANASGVISCTDDDGGAGSSEWTDAGSFLHPADLSGAEDIVIGGTTTGASDIWLQASGAAVFNEQGANQNFRIEGDTVSSLFVANAADDSVRIGLQAAASNADLFLSGNLRMLVEDSDAFIFLQSDDNGDQSPAYIWSEDTIGFSVGTSTAAAQFWVETGGQGAAYFQAGTDQSVAFQVNESGGQAYLTVDTSSAGDVQAVEIGNGTDDVVFTLDSFNTDPTGTIPDGSMFYDADGDVFRCRVNGSWVNCDTGGGGGSATQHITLIPEFGGGTLSADGSSNNGTMSADHVTGLSSGQGYKHNYYNWISTQGSTNDYDIIINYQLPSDFNASNEFNTSSWQVWTWSDTLADTTITMTVEDQDLGTACINAENIETTTVNTWELITLSTNPNTNCVFSADDIITITIKMGSQNSANVRLGEIEFEYDT